MPRLFTGLELPSDISFELGLLKGGIPGARWIDTASFHITLRFAGDISDAAVDELDQALAGLLFEPFELQLKGAGYFGGNRPRALYVDVGADDRLNHLQAAHERICQSIGLVPESRKFTPHVTIARLRNTSSEAVNHYVSRHSLYRSRRFPVTRFALFSARPSRGGGPYAVEQVYDLEPSM